MSKPQADHRLRAARSEKGWSQAELARRAGVSRTAVSAAENGRLVPSVTAALALAEALGHSVEALFGRSPSSERATQWAWGPPGEAGRYWHADVGDRRLLYPVEPTASGEVAHDGLHREGRPSPHPRFSADETLVMAGCDPASGLLTSEYARATGLRLIVLPRSSRQALALLKQGLVHLAGVHLSAADASDGNARAVAETFGDRFSLLHLVRWEEGLTLSTAARGRTVRSVLRAKLSWVGREAGSGARQCLDELRSSRRPPRRLAHDHRGVAEAVRCGWADVGVCLRLVSEEAGLRFLSVRDEAYDLVVPAGFEDDPRVRALVRVVRSSTYRRLLGGLPGYDATDTGELRTRGVGSRR